MVGCSAVSLPRESLGMTVLRSLSRQKMRGRLFCGQSHGSGLCHHRRPACLHNVSFIPCSPDVLCRKKHIYYPRPGESMREAMLLALICVLSSDGSGLGAIPRSKSSEFSCLMDIYRVLIYGRSLPLPLRFRWASHSLCNDHAIHAAVEGLAQAANPGPCSL